ncbi:MAG: kelch repeat-containing protein [Candidatus Limnocylindrales bacterium]
MSDGRVLIAGGEDANENGFASAELYDPKTGQFTATGSMTAARYAHTATLLSDGRVLIAGGRGSDGGPVASAELYDPTSGTFSTTGSMTTVRGGQTATRLMDGRVLITGGRYVCCESPGPDPAAADLYDPKTGTFSATGSMTADRVNQTATLLPDGRVLIMGGEDSGKLADLYDPMTGKFTAAGSTARVRSAFTATLLPAGLVLLAGGWGGDSDLASADLYDPKTGIFRATGFMSTARQDHTATRLSDGRVLVAGGYNNPGIIGVDSQEFASAELYDPGTGRFSATGSMASARYDFTATLLSDGRVLVAGGANDDSGVLASAELYQP